MMEEVGEVVQVEVEVNGTEKDNEDTNAPAFLNEVNKTTLEDDSVILFDRDDRTQPADDVIISDGTSCVTASENASDCGEQAKENAQDSNHRVNENGNGSGLPFDAAQPLNVNEDGQQDLEVYDDVKQGPQGMGDSETAASSNSVRTIEAETSEILTTSVQRECQPLGADSDALTEEVDLEGLSPEELERQNAELIMQNEDQKKVIEMLRVELTRKDEELVSSETAMKSLHDKYEKELQKMKEETSKKISDLKKAYEQANRDKESMVIKYAMGEKDILIAKKSREVVEKRLVEANKDKESLQYKIKTLSNERTRLQGLCDVRGQETLAAKREGDKWKEEVKQMEAKLTAANSKLKAEADAHRETQDSLEKTASQLAEVQGSIDKVKAECQEVIDKHKQEEMKAKRIEKEQEVKLLIDSVAAEELENLRKKHKLLLEENNDLSIKVQAGEKERLGYESSLSVLKETANKQKSEIVDLYAKCAELESVKIQLDREMEKCAAKDSEVARLRAEAVESQADMSSCRSKEAELLEFTQKLTDKNVILQSEFTNMEVRANTLEEEHSRLVTALAKAESRLTEVESQLTSETGSLTSEVTRLKTELTSRVGECKAAVQQSIDAKNEVDVLRRQHTARVRELTKELNSTKKRLDTLDPEREVSPGLSPASRTSSSGSLHKPDMEVRGGGYHETSPGLLKLSPRPSAPVSPVVNGSEKSLGSDVNRNQYEGGVPDTQVLIEKIVKLQRACARRQEKIDFLEEHVDQLLTEVKKKNKIFQHYVQNIEPGALVSEQSDIHKAVILQQGGIMSSVYGSKVNDSGLTFELCLEMNKKLQAVLEDTLLKNITLKENINTLGTEIAKISMEKR